MAKHGTFRPFTGDAEDWSAYTERLGQYLIANDISAAAKKSTQRLWDIDLQTDKKFIVTSETQRSGVS